MTTLIEGLADTHFTEKKPRSRKDNYQETVLRKLTDVINLASSIRWEGKTRKVDALVIAGDIFHQPQGKLISRKLDYRIISKLSTSPVPILAILGNHDKDHDREDSIEDHPLGSLVAANIITLVHWPEYRVIGTDPPVIITGRQYTIDGPGTWLDHLKESGELRDLKEKLSEERQKQVQTLVLTHCYWGPNDGALRGDPIVGHRRLLGTGVDVCSYGHPHCVSADTWVETVEQGLQQIGALRGDAGGWVNLSVPTDNDVYKATKIHNFGKYPTIRIKTTGGFVLNAVANHRVRRVREDYEWVRMDEIKKGDRLVIKLGTEWPKKDPGIDFKDNTVDKERNVWIAVPDCLDGDWAEFLGWVVAEGKLNREDAKDPDLLEWSFGIEQERDYGKSLLIKLGISISTEWRSHGGWNLRICSKQFCSWLRFIGVGHAEDKEIPWPVLRGTKEINRRFMLGYCGGDNCVSKINVTVKTGTVGRKLGYQIQQVWRRLGILVGIYGDKRKLQKSSRTDKAINASERFRVITSSANVEELKAVLRTGFKGKERQEYSDKAYNHQNLGRRQIARYKDDMPLVSVLSIEPSEAVVCDLTQPTTHTYITNGFISHNTDDGVVELIDEDRKISIVGPGAFTRGTLAEIDIHRQPKIFIAAFKPDGAHEVITVPIPHEAADKVFDFVGHSRVKKEKEAEEKFVKALATTNLQLRTTEEVLVSVAATIPPGVISRFRNYCTKAEDMIGKK